jgi:hypothetical protein
MGLVGPFCMAHSLVTAGKMLRATHESRCKFQAGDTRPWRRFRTSSGRPLYQPSVRNGLHKRGNFYRREIGEGVGYRVRQDNLVAVTHCAASADNVGRIILAFGRLRSNSLSEFRYVGMNAGDFKVQVRESHLFITRLVITKRRNVTNPQRSLVVPNSAADVVRRSTFNRPSPRS